MISHLIRLILACQMDHQVCPYMENLSTTMEKYDVDKVYN